MFKRDWLLFAMVFSYIILANTVGVCGEYTGVLYNPESGRDEPVYKMMDEAFKFMTEEEKKELKEQEKTKRDEKAEEKIKKGVEFPVPMGNGDGAWFKGGSEVNDAGKTYQCILDNTSSPSNRPPNVTYWRPKPYNSSIYPWASGVAYKAPAFPGYNRVVLYTYMFVHPNNSVFIDQAGEGLPNSWVYTTALGRLKTSDGGLEFLGTHYGTGGMGGAKVYDWTVTIGSEANFNPGSGTQTYRCILSHTASSGNQPPNSTYWTQITYNGSGTRWIEYTNYQEDSPGPNQSDPYNRWQWTKSLSDSFWAPYITTFSDPGGVTRKAIYYANESLLAQSGEPQTRRNAVYLWNFNLSRWDNIYIHDYRRNKPYLGGTWGPIIEYDDVSWVFGTDGLKYRCKKDHTSSATTRPTSGANWSTYWVQDNNSTGWLVTNWLSGRIYYQKKYIKELGYANAQTYWTNDSGSGNSLLTDVYTTWDAPSPNWILFRRTPNYTYGMGNSTDE